MKRYTISLITGMLLTASALPRTAQEDASGLTLEKDGEQVLIPLGEWVAVSSAYDPSNTVRGIYLGMKVDALRIQEKGGSFEREFPTDEIGSIFTGKIKKYKGICLRWRKAWCFNCLCLWGDSRYFFSIK